MEPAAGDPTPRCTFQERRSAERGASAVEYGLLVAGIAAVVVVVIYAFGGNLVTMYDNTCKTVGDGTSSAAQATC